MLVHNRLDHQLSGCGYFYQRALQHKSEGVDLTVTDCSNLREVIAEAGIKFSPAPQAGGPQEVLGSGLMSSGG